ncbi:uncharacterized protein LOC144105223 [Amblyomma americanum]
MSTLVIVFFIVTMFATVRAFLRLNTLNTPEPLRRKTTTTSVILWTNPTNTPASPKQTSTTTPALTRPPITQTRLPKTSLICTMGDHLSTKSIELPPDGVCTIIFYDSLYKRGGSTLSAPFEKNFQRFLNATDAHNITQFGIGFDYGLRRNTMVLASDPATKTQLESLWQRRIYHIGHVNTPAFNVGVRDIADVIKSAWTIANLMLDKDINERPVYTAVAVPVINVKVAEFIVEQLRTALVDIVIGLAHHVGEDKNKPNCLMMTPSYMDSPSPDYPFSLRLWHEVFQTIGDAQLPTTLAMSVGIPMRRYKPRNPDQCAQGDSDPSKNLIMAPCKTFQGPQLADALEVCQSRTPWEPHLSWDVATWSEYYLDKSGCWLYTNDGTYSLRYKLCEVKTNYTSLKYIIAAMDIDYSDPRFYILLWLQSLIRFFQNVYTVPDMTMFCHALDTYPPCLRYNR